MARSYVDIINDETMTWKQKQALINKLGGGREEEKEKKKVKKLLKETLEDIMDSDIEEFFQWFDEVYKLNSKYENGVVFEPTPQDCYSYFDKKGIHINVQTAMMLCQVQKSFTNTKAAEFVRDTMGQKPVATAEVNVNLEARKELAELAKLLDE